ncbi:hypothetical protein PSW78_23175, partial [Shigella flexneri]|nr:hypothetical protein [Shigella flexneri]
TSASINPVFMYPGLLSIRGYINTGFIDAEVLIEYIRKHSPLDIFDKYFSINKSGIYAEVLIEYIQR